MSRVAALIVTRDSQRWIEATLASVVAQTRQPDLIVVVDDHSTDRTLAIVEALSGGRAEVHASSSQATDRTSRIAQNFQQGIRACAGYDAVVLGDHDDVWFPLRIEHQLSILAGTARATMVASDGLLVDESGVPAGGTLRGSFAVPRGFNALSPDAQMRVALRRLLATGGASALRPSGFADLTIPDGWLHDRWWSLVATARESMVVDDGVVIDYRLSTGQQVGLNSGNVNRSARSRLAAAAGRLGPSMRKLTDIRRELLPLATPRTAPELDGWRLLRNLL